MIELLSIWVACFFWAIVFSEMGRKELRETQFRYYDGGLFLFWQAVLAPGFFLIVMYFYVHEQSR